MAHRVLSVALASAFILIATDLATTYADELDESIRGRCCGPNFLPHPSIQLRVTRQSLLRRPPEGYYNNLRTTEWGSRGETQRRLLPSEYSDGISRPAGACVTGGTCPYPNEHLTSSHPSTNGVRLGSVRPPARQISNIVGEQLEITPSRRNIGDILVHFGQFLAHDTELSPENTSEPLRLSIPKGDPVFDRSSTGTQYMDFVRSGFESRCTGKAKGRPREIRNLISAIIDGTPIYGATTERLNHLRDISGKRGLMKISTGNLMPLNTLGVENANPRGFPAADLYAGGDIRINEAIGLASMNTLFLREHNYQARLFRSMALLRGKRVSGRTIFAYARRKVIATLQKIAFEEYIPAMFGRKLFGGSQPRYRYRSSVQPQLDNSFAAAARRFGHSQVNGILPVLNGSGSLENVNSLQLGDTLFRVHTFLKAGNGGIEPFLRGFLCLRAQQIDIQIDSNVRNRLFPTSADGPERDLLALNIQRGRDHGLPTYNAFREKLRGSKASSFGDITRNPTLRDKLRDAYASKVGDIDLFVGLMAEDNPEGANSEFGPTLSRLLERNFRRIAMGDRHFYKRIMSQREIDTLPTFSQLIKRNTRGIPKELLPDKHSVFFNPLFCESVKDFKCVPRQTRLQSDVCDMVYDLPGLTGVFQSSPRM